MMDKKQLRNDMLRKLNKFSKREYANLSHLIHERLFMTAEFNDSRIIGLTMSRFPEVETRPIIEKAWKMGKKIAVPKCHPVTREMDFRILTSYDDLEIVYNGLLEPIENKTESVAKHKIDSQIVPGVIFSEEGYRIGYGGGYYDRYMVDFVGKVVSLAFDVQLTSVLPIEMHDIPVGKIITETNIIDCKKG